MSIKHTRQTTGILFILGAVLVNVPYTLLIMNFDYPDILRKPAGEILERFAAGGSSLTWTWLSFAWVGLPLLFAILLLPKVLNDESPLGLLALFFGAVGAFVQMVGLLRWPFVVPILARLYIDPQASAATQEAVVAVFQAIHQYGGVVTSTISMHWRSRQGLCLDTITPCRPIIAFCCGRSLDDAGLRPSLSAA